MISRENYKTIHIHIKTYKVNQEANFPTEEMHKEQREGKFTNRFICSICLNSGKKNQESDNKIAKLPVLKHCSEKSKIRIKDEYETCLKKHRTENKGVQTLQTDLNKSLNLLNEVLTVFRNKKQIEAERRSKTVALKDANISTDNINLKSKLSVNKIFQFSVDDEKYINNKHIIMTSHDDIVRSKSLMDLPKYKSSSIPQMKVEELKHSLKEKTKSKDAIEEVNRMFATVRRKRRDFSDVSNRPSVRNGPRVLPVVKTRYGSDKICECVENLSPVCKCCQDCLSSGDSGVNCHNKQNQTGKSDKCVYMMCCHYKNYRKMMYCERCNERDFRFNRDGDINFDDND